MKKALAAILVISLFATGCALGVLAGGIGYAVSSSKNAEAKIQQSYGDYKLGMEKINLERESKGLEPRPIMTLEEWRTHQAPAAARAEKPAPETQQQAGLGGSQP